jgi:hypothetical protein
MKRIILITLFITLLSTHILFGITKHFTPKEKVLIVLLDGQASWFKQTIIDSLMTNYDIEVIQGKKPGDIKADNYKAVVVMDKLKAWMWFNGKLKKYTKFLDPKHTVYFVTSGDPKWQWKKPGINAVTSASKNAKVGEVVKKLRDSINHETH